MSLFPDIWPSNEDYSIIPSFKTLRLGPTDGDFIQRRKKRTIPLWTIGPLRWNLKNSTDEETLHNFFNARDGGYEAFNIYDFITRNWSSVIIGNGDDTTTKYDLGCKESTNREIMVNGATQTSGVNFNFTATASTQDGQDYITFTTALSTGTTITVSYRGRRYFNNCIFLEDDMPRSYQDSSIFRTGLTIIQVST